MLINGRCVKCKETLGASWWATAANGEYICASCRVSELESLLTAKEKELAEVKRDFSMNEFRRLEKELAEASEYLQRCADKGVAIAMSYFLAKSKKEKV